ncbi:hypothetical protein ACETU7_20515 [Rhodococcus sp. 3Y1]
MKPNEYIEHDATGLAELIRDKQVSVDEVHQAARTAIETVNPTLNAVVEGPWDRALDCNEQGLFAGFPLHSRILPYTRPEYRPGSEVGWRAKVQSFLTTPN